jgi:hypothetical protein
MMQQNMTTENLISLNLFCISQNVDISFIQSLEQNGLVEITTIEDAGFIDASQLKNLEQIIRFYYDLEINLEGIETITHLLKRIHALQDNITGLRNRLRLYETGAK